MSLRYMVSKEGEDEELQKLYTDIDTTLAPLKAILDKYPGSFTLDYHPKEGYFIDYDVACLVRLLREFKIGTQLTATQKLFFQLDDVIKENPDFILDRLKEANLSDKSLIELAGCKPLEECLKIP